MHELLQVFEGLFLEVPRAVLFHAIAIHCHNGMEDNDISVFLGSVRVTALPPILSFSQPQKIEKCTSEINCHKESIQDIASLISS